ncbi:MAG: regulatory protein GemA [Proteobacteria bacterium]|nr:regulatory protein GemA [Pseudomonadota bacterium]
MANNHHRALKTNKPDQRRRDLAAIHIGKEKLGMDDITYREMLVTIAGVKSSADLDQAGREKVLNHLWKRGFKPPLKSARASGMHVSPSRERAPYLHKIGALLAATELSWAYADGIGKKMFGVEKVRWLDPDQLRKVLAALVYNQKRIMEKEKQNQI